MRPARCTTIASTPSYGFGAINIANVLADAGLEPRRHYFIVLDELWRALRAGRGWSTASTPCTGPRTWR